MMIDFSAFISIILSLIVIILTVIVIILTYRNFRFSKLVATHQGVFRIPNIKVSAYELDPIPDYFIISCKLNPKRILFVPLSIRLENMGDKSADEVKFAIRYHKRLRLDGSEFAKISPRTSKSLAPVVLEDSNFQTLVYEIGTLTPKEGFNILDFINIKESSILKFNADAMTKNGVKMISKVHITYVNVIDYTIFQDDVEPITGRINILVIDTSKQSLEYTINLLNQRRMKKFRKEVGNIFKHILYYLKLKYLGKQIGKRFELIYYDESKVISHPDNPMDQVPINSMRFCSGSEDITGRLFVPAIGIL